MEHKLNKLTVNVKGRRLPDSLTVDRETYRQHTKLKHSMFSFTFNTNIRPKNRDEATMLDDGYYEAMEKTFAESENVRKMLRVVDNVEKNETTNKKTFLSHPMTPTEFDSCVKRIEVRHQNELGTNYKYGGRFHIHGYIYVLHTSFLHVDFDRVLAFVNKYAAMTRMPLLKYAHFTIEKPSMKLYMKKQYFM